MARSKEELTYEGLRAQYAFCEILGVPFDWEIKKWGDGGVDVTGCGKKGQIKYNTWRPPVGELYFRDSQPWIEEVAYSILSVPVIELCNGRGKGMSLGGIEFVGWTTRSRFLQCSRRDVWPGNDTPVTTMKAIYLYKMESLFEQILPYYNVSSKDFRQPSLF